MEVDFLSLGVKLWEATAVQMQWPMFRGNKVDFDDWEALGNTGWGIKSVLLYFVKSEDNVNFDGIFHGKNGLLNVVYSKQLHSLGKHFLEACIQNGIPANPDYNDDEQLGASMLKFNISNSRK